MRRPGLLRMLGRGLFRRCPWCGGRRAFFTGWFSKQDRCATCGLGWRRGDVGYELGAMTINIIVTFGALLTVAGVGIVLTLPDVRVVPVLVTAGLVAVLLPILVYPVSYTLWQAVDLAMRPPAAGDFEPSANHP